MRSLLLLVALLPCLHAWRALRLQRMRGGDSAPECRDGVCPVPDPPGNTSQGVGNATQLALEQVLAAGWDAGAAAAAVEQCDGNATAALIVLEAEEATIQSEFEKGVESMCTNGWDADVARQALYHQYVLDQKRARGEPLPQQGEMPNSVAQMRPTLRAQPVLPKEKPKAPKAKKPKAKKAKKAKKLAETPAEKPPQTPTVKREDVVFELTSVAQLQPLIFDYTGPGSVLVDVYADWCGPCKQLTPVLEEAAMKLGGYMRVVKINSDKFPQLSRAFGVSALPSVFRFTDGELVDNMVGVPGQAALQKFLIDSAMSKPNAEPNPTEERKLSAAERLQMTRSLALIAGNANLEDGVKTQMEAAFKPQLEKLPIAPAAGAEDAVKAVRTATKYVSNALTDAKKFGTIPTSAAAFKATVASFPGLPSVLVTMGFEQKDDKLVLGHRNRAKLAIGLSTLNAWIVKANKAKQEADLKNRVIQLARKKKEEARAAKNGGNVAKKASKAPEDDGAKAAARAVKDPVSKPTAAAKKHEKNGGAEAQKAAAGVKDADKVSPAEL